jgi:hypothetical protein
MRELIQKIKTNKKFLLSLPVAFISLEIYFGIIFGYFFGKFISGKKPGQKGLVKSIVLNFGNYKLHLHHWLISLGILFSNFLIGLYLPFHQFSLSFLGGLIIQGILCYPDWHKVIIREN